MRSVLFAGVVVALLLATQVMVGCSQEASDTSPEATPTAGVSQQAESDSEAQQTETGQEIAQTKCPVMGGDIDEDIYVDYKGRRIYFCCPGCPEKFKENPEKYIDKLDASAETGSDVSKGETHEGHMGHETEAKSNEQKIVQTTCPVMGGEINKDLYVDYKGRRVYFCCPGCPEKFKENPEKYVQKLEAQKG